MPWWNVFNPVGPVLFLPEFTIDIQNLLFLIPIFILKKYCLFWQKFQLCTENVPCGTVLETNQKSHL